MLKKSNRLYVCYSGTGKTELAAKYNNFIDLDSSTFWHTGNWLGNYCRTAVALLKTHNVIISSSRDVVKYLSKIKQPFTLVFPDIGLQEYWQAHLKDIALIDPSPRNIKSAEFSAKYYDLAINGMINDNFHNKIIIKSEGEFLEQALEKRGKLC